jgi:signal transduction histidine kinase
VLFVLVFVLRVTFYNPNDGLGLFFCLPVTLAAVRFGPRAGLLCGLLAFALFVAWAQQGNPYGVTAVGYASRLTVFVTIGWFVGHFARARDELDIRSRRLFDVSPDLMGAVGERGDVITANDAWSRDPVAAAQFGRAVEQGALRRNDEQAPFEQQVTRPDGSPSWIEWHVRPDPDGSVQYVVGRDVTERKAHAAHVGRLLTELQDAGNVERKRISADLHDFVLQQLLVAMMHVESGEQAGGAASELAQVDRFVRDATSSLRRIIDGIQPLDVEHLTTRAALEQVVRAIERDYGVQVSSVVEVQGDLPPDRRLLCYRLAGEALRNAAKHAEADRIGITATDGPEGIEVEVTDNGRGMASEVAARDALTPALGTGFNLLVEQVLAHGGHVRINSTPGAGTTVGFSLPVAE